MIRIKVTFNKYEHIVDYFCQGHAQRKNNQDKHYLAVCNSISILEYQFFYGFKEIFKQEFMDYKIHEGFFKISLPAMFKTSPQVIRGFFLVCQYFLIGINLVAKNYPNYVQLNLQREKNV